MRPTSMLSDLWYRVCDLKPRLRSHVRIHRHDYRDLIWFLLQDPLSGRVSRFGPAARTVVSLMDGKRSVNDLWQIALNRLGDEAPTQGEMIELLAQLHAADMLQSDVTPDVGELFARSQKEKQSQRKQAFGNPMAVRVSLWDPNAFLDRFPKTIRAIWSRFGAAVWIATILPAFFLLLQHWPELSNNFSDRILATDNIFLLYFIFPLIKFIHEMGHATATKAGGGEVHDLGLTVLVLLPVPYVEASAATTFRSKYQRALVGAAGVAFELFVAAIAFYLWLIVEPGVFRAVLFNVMVIGGVSTLVFNGNPLLRYDAYYILADLIEIPNLSSKSTGYWGYLIDRYAFGSQDAENPHISRTEAFWLMFYGMASTCYRAFVTLVIALFLAGKFFFIGVILAIWAVAGGVAAPLFRGIGHVMRSPRLRSNRRQAVSVSLLAVLGLGGTAAFIPIPYHFATEGVVWLPEEALVRTHANCFFVKFLVPGGAHVSKGEALTECDNVELRSELLTARSRVREWQASYDVDRANDFKKAQITASELEQQKSALASLEVQTADLVAHAGSDGSFVVPQMRDQVGRYFKKGDLLGYVIGRTQLAVRVVIPQEAVDSVRLGSGHVEVRLVDRPDVTLDGRVVRVVPGGEEFLPSRALSIEGGGTIATDPRESRGAKAMQRMFQVDVAVGDPDLIKYFGQRAFVRFERPDATLIEQFYQRIRQMFLSKFEV